MEFHPPIEVVLVKEEIADENFVLQDENVLDEKEVKEEDDEFSAIKKPKNIDDNVQYSSSLCEERHVENFLSRVKTETGFNLIHEEIQLKDESLFEDSDSEDKSNSKLQNDGRNKPDCNPTFSEGGKKRGTDLNVANSKLYKYDKCTKTFSYSSEATEEPPLDCKTCKKSFHTSTDLIKHIRTHIGQKPYECDVCDKAFTTKSQLIAHQRTHNNERPFKCSVCHKTFTESGHLTRHTRIHTGEKPFQCKMCQYKCATTGSLKRHMRIHTGEKPFQCEVCQYKCAQTSDLKKHIRIHTGEKPFTCI